VVANDLPDVKATLPQTKTKIEAALVVHYRCIRLLAPQIALSEASLTPREAHLDPILLPSGLDLDLWGRCGLREMAEVEKRLRIGQAHDAIEATRKSLGLRSWMTRHARDASNYTTITRAQQSVRRSEMTVKSCAKLYQRAWKALGDLKVPTERLLGLQELKEDHLKTLGSWLEDEGYRPGKSSSVGEQTRFTLPWIWRMNRVAVDETASDELALRVEAWNLEGELFGMSSHIEADNLLVTHPHSCSPRVGPCKGS